LQKLSDYFYFVLAKGGPMELIKIKHLNLQNFQGDQGCLIFIKEKYFSKVGREGR
jgi:hypothetical protein